MSFNNATDAKQEGVQYLDSSGTWSGLDGGTSGHFLLSNGTGVAPSFQALSNEGVQYQSSGGVWSGLDGGAAGNILVSNGTGVAPSFQPVASHSTITPVTGPTTYAVVSSDQFLACQTSGGAITIQLPNTTTTGRVITIKDSSGNANVNHISVTTPGGIVTIDGVTSFLMHSNFGSINVIFDGTSYEVF